MSKDCRSEDCYWCVYCTPVGSTVNTPQISTLYKCVQGIWDKDYKDWIISSKYPYKTCKYFFCRICHESKCEFEKLKEKGKVDFSDNIKYHKDELNQFYKDFYNGKIKIRCGEDCPDNCDSNHGYYKLGDYENLFNEEK